MNDITVKILEHLEAAELHIRNPYPEQLITSRRDAVTAIKQARALVEEIGK